MSGAELENLFHLGHARKHRERIDINNAIYAHFGVLAKRASGTDTRQGTLHRNAVAT